MTAGDARTLGLVGLGVMGGPMARRLLDAGDRVLAHDIDVAAMDALADAGAHPCPDARAVADAAEIVLVSLPSQRRRRRSTERWPDDHGGRRGAGRRGGSCPAGDSRLLEVISASSGTNAAAAVKFPRYVLTRTFHQAFAST